MFNGPAGGGGVCVVELVNIREMCNLLPNSQSSAVSPVPGGKEWLQTSWVPRGLTAQTGPSASQETAHCRRSQGQARGGAPVRASAPHTVCGQSLMGQEQCGGPGSSPPGQLGVQGGIGIPLSPGEMHSSRRREFREERR